jgi:hypothetical protein
MSEPFSQRNQVNKEGEKDRERVRERERERERREEDRERKHQRRADIIITRVRRNNTTQLLQP